MVLARVGHVTVAWNEAEHLINQMLWLYLDTDVLTAEILTKPMRATDREKLLKALVAAKEIDQAVATEIGEALKICAVCRDNRNTVLHNAGGETGEFGARALESMTLFCREMDTTVAYLRDLRTALTRVIFERGSRETPIGDESSNDELLPPIVFVVPVRPKAPRRLQKQDILRDG
jgi:hypothetical protein